MSIPKRGVKILNNNIGPGQVVPQRHKRPLDITPQVDPNPHVVKKKPKKKEPWLYCERASFTTR